MELDNVVLNCKLKNDGFAQSELNLPLVLVFYDKDCDELKSNIKYGVLSEGCAVQFCPLPEVNSLAIGANAKELLLPMREVIADLVFSMLEIHRADGALIVCSSITTAAGAMLGAIRKNLPLAFMPNVKMSSNTHPLLLKAQTDAASLSLSQLEEQISLTHDFVDDFISLMLFFEGAGLCELNSLIESKVELARNSARLAAIRTKNLLCPRKEFTLNSFNGGLMLHLCFNGTLSSLLDIIALGKENGLDVNYEHIEKIASKVAQIEYEGSIIDLLKECSTTAIIQSLIDKKLILVESQTEYFFRPYQNKTASLSPKFSHQSRLTRVKGNLCDDGLSRHSEAIKPFKGQVYAFESESLAKAAILGDTIEDNSAIIIHSQSAKDNGMPPLDIESALIAKNLLNVLVITDGRLIEFKQNNIVCMLDKTETLDIIKTGDTIELDLKKGKLNLSLSSKDTAARIKRLVKPPIKSQTLAKFAVSVSPPSQGCTTKKY